MSIQQAEKLKRELTDKWVVVADGVPELRRFAQLTGQVRTVNMNCRALVQFDGPEDISWYDIEPQFLTVVDAPRPKAVTAEADHKAPAKAAPAARAATSGGSPLDKIRAAGGAAKPAAKPAGGSPLDKIRAQSSGGAQAAPTAKPAGGSPLDKIRAGGAGGAQTSKPATADESTAGTEPAVASKNEPPAKKDKPAAGGSPLDQIRARGGFKG
ncbi:MAG: hypothetical protein R3C59_29940 [Planctomycetaceae bacterium]